MIKAVIFDYGGVISNGGKGSEVSDRLAKILGVSDEDALVILTEPWKKLLNGLVDENGFWRIIEKESGSKVSMEKRNIWNSWKDMTPRPEVIDFIEELKNNNYIVGLLSNIMPHTEALIRKAGVYDLFNPCVLSFQVGYAKPDIEIYEELLRRLPEINPKNVIFVDDQERCLAPAKAKGINVVLATSAEQIIADVKNLLIAK